MNNLHDDFYHDYRLRYNRYWIRRLGMIPHLPTSLDNSNSIYELLAWLQRAFKGLLDDFINQQIEFEQFKNAITELLEVLVPELIRKYVKSDEFRKIIYGIIDEWYEEKLKPIIEKIQDDIENNKQEINNLKNEIKNINNKLDNIKNANAEINEKLKALDKIINKLAEIGVWDKDKNDFKEGMGIAGGNINLFGGEPDGNSYIRTNNGQSENDLTGGI